MLRVEITLVTTMVALGGLFALSTLPSGSPSAEYDVIATDDLEPFRSAFNGAADRVRLVLLVGPT